MQEKIQGEVHESKAGDFYMLLIISIYFLFLIQLYCLLRFTTIC